MKIWEISSEMKMMQKGKEHSRVKTIFEKITSWISPCHSYSFWLVWRRLFSCLHENDSIQVVSIHRLENSFRKKCADVMKMIFVSPSRFSHSQLHFTSYIQFCSGSLARMYTNVKNSYNSLKIHSAQVDDQNQKYLFRFSLTHSRTTTNWIQFRALLLDAMLFIYKISNFFIGIAPKHFTHSIRSTTVSAFKGSFF